MTVRRIQDEDIDPGGHQGLRSLLGVGPRADRRTDTQTAFFVLGRVGVLTGFFNVLDGDQAFKTVILVHQRQLFYAMLVQDPFGLIKSCPHRTGDQIPRHHILNRLIEILFENQIAIGQDPHQESVLFRDGHSRDVVTLHDRQGISDAVLGRKINGIDNDAALRTLHLIHFDGLVLDTEIAMDNADATFTRQSDRQAALSYGIHGRTHQRYV